MRVALYGDVNLNLVDGSAIWLAALAETLALDPSTRVTVFLKSPIERDLVVAPLIGRDNVDLVADPDRRARLTPAQALDLIEQHDTGDPTGGRRGSDGAGGRRSDVAGGRRSDGAGGRRFDVVLLRGFALCQQAAGRERLEGRLWTYLTDIPQQPHLATDEDRAALARIALASQRVLCQTDELRAYLEGLVPDTAWRTTLLPPMVPEGFLRGPRPLSDRPKLFYAGKFAPLWGFLETVEAFTKLRADHPDLQLHVAGDKIHDPPDDPAYAPAVRAALEDTPGLVWHGAVSRQQVAGLLAGCDIALSARHPSMDASLELSTKVLEYGAANVPVVLNRNPMHARLFGGDYPLFIDGLDDLAAVIGRTLASQETWRAARDTARRVAEDFTFPRVLARLERPLRAAAPLHGRAPRRKRVLLAGHDLKFTGPLASVLERAGVEVRRDVWTGHTGHDEAASKKALAWADVVWAEWCLGNAVWYADRVSDAQRLVVRLHRQELTTDFPGQIQQDAVDRLLVVAPFIGRAVVDRFGWDPGRITFLPNTVDTIPFDRPKLDGAHKRLGLVGYLPSIKRLDLALDLLEHLLVEDRDWQLWVAGALPWESDWVWARLLEREHYRDQFDRIRGSPRLSRAVRFEGRVGNIPGWFAAVGNILSLSDLESFHLALAEGMASRAVPVIRARDGVDELFPGQPAFGDVDGMAGWLLELSADPSWRREVAEAARALIVDRYDLAPVGEQFLELVLEPR